MPERWERHPQQNLQEVAEEMRLAAEHTHRAVGHMREDGMCLHWCDPCGMSVSQTHECPHQTPGEG